MKTNYYVANAILLFAFVIFCVSVFFYFKSLDDFSWSRALALSHDPPSVEERVQNLEQFVVESNFAALIVLFSLGLWLTMLSLLVVRLQAGSGPPGKDAAPGK